ncbi:response regulator [Paenibacillus cymbidii]|uniref:response regulator n=1 Tax=Paenibacillus cymbidii TaxID=1639034 RepID=UPI0010815EBA|nr:response regulator [Paenibacillus cymbidii]
MPKHIAIVDDSGAFCLLVKQLLEIDEEYVVEAFADADEFLKISSRIRSYDLIMLDINMPGTNGLSALGQLQASAHTKSVPVLLLSGDSRKSTVTEGVMLGAKDFLMKPIDPAQLIERVHAIVNRPS